MSGNINTELNTVKVQEPSVSSSSVSQSSSSKVNTVFEAATEVVKKKKVLTPQQESLLRSKGFDPSVMSEEEIRQALLGIIPAPETNPASSQKNIQEAPVQPAIDENNAETVQTSSPQSEASGNVQNTQQQEDVQAQQTKTSSVVYSKEDIKIDYNSEKSRLFALDPSKTGVFGCDIDEMPVEKASDFLLQELTKNQLGDEKWSAMSKEQQLKAMQDIDAQLAEKVPSWNELQADGKAELAKFFVMGAPEFEAKINKNIEVAKQSLDTQLEELAGFIVSKKHDEAELENAHKAFGKEVSAYIEANPKYAGKTREELNESGEYNNIMLAYLEEKLEKNDGNINNLNNFERKLYKQLEVGKSLSPNGDLKNWGSYGKEGEFDRIISDTNDMLKADLVFHAKYSDEYKEAFKNRIMQDFENGDTSYWTGESSQFKALMENGNPLDRMMMLEIFQKLPQDVQEKINLELSQRIQNIGVAAANGDDNVTKTALQQARLKAKKEGQNKVLDKSIENINRIIKDKKVATESITEGLTIGGADGYKKGVQEGKILAEQVTDVNNIVLDKKNNDKYEQSVQSKVVETIGYSTVEGRKGLIDKATENERTIKATAANYDTFGKDFEVYSAQKILENAETILPEKEAIEVLKIAADTNTRCAAENQAEIHKVFMNSKYDEVLEHAASNIYKYDESAQADAIKYTYETNNTKAIDACNGQIEQCSPEAVQKVGREIVEASVEQTVQRIISEASDNYANAVIENNKITNNLTEPEEFKGLSDSTKAQRLYESFKKSTPAEQYRMLSKLSKDQLKAVIGILCKANSSVIKGLVSQGLGSYVLQTIGKSPDVLYMTVDIMMKKGGKDAKCASEYVVAKQSITHFSDDTIVKANEILGHEDITSLPDSETQKYISNPYGFMKSALKPGMSAVYPGKKELFFKA